MHNTVVIKSNKAGVTVYLDPDIPFSQLLADVGKKFGDSSRFWGSAQMTLTLEGRQLTANEEFQIVNQITVHSDLEIVCLVDTDVKRIERCEKALNEKLMELSSQTGQFFKGNLQNGETLESEASIVVIGDVMKGARIMAKGNIVIVGRLMGSVCAGVSGNDQAVITALEMSPAYLRIGDYILPSNHKGKKLCRGPATACVENDHVSIKQMKKTMEIFRKLR